jgi:sugar phosphate isomerase/epimerase
VKSTTEWVNAAKKNGFRLQYHNHFEIGQTFDGERVIDIIAHNTDPELVYFQPDTYWVMRAGIDPILLFSQLQGRISQLHLKDFPKDALEPVCIYEVIGQEQTVSYSTVGEVARRELFSDIGFGITDIAKLIAAAERYTTADCILIDQDFCELSELKSLKVCVENIEKAQTEALRL